MMYCKISIKGPNGLKTQIGVSNMNDDRFKFYKTLNRVSEMMKPLFISIYIIRCIKATQFLYWRLTPDYSYMYYSQGIT